MRRFRVAVLFVLSSVALSAAAANAASTIFVPLPPCRIADTRVAGGPIASNTNRTFKVVGVATDFTSQGGSASGCGVPGFSGIVPQVQAIALNVAAANHTGAGFLTAFAGDISRPLASTLNFTAGTTIANGVIVPVRQAPPEGNDLKVFVNVTSDVFMDVTGYFTDITLVDGSASGIDADTLDGLDSSVFGDITGVTAGTGLSGGATSGNATLNLSLAASNTWTGNTTFDPATGFALTTGAGDDINLGGNVRKSGALFLHNNGSDNLGVGLNALKLSTTGTANVAVGASALAANTTGVGNIAIGKRSLYSNTSSGYSIAIGRYSLYANTTGGANIAIGTNALSANTSGGGNIAIGHDTMLTNTTGFANTAIGGFALSLNTTGYRNTATGSTALRNNTTGQDNTASGDAALLYNTTGSRNTATGGVAMRNNTTGYKNTATGLGALYGNTTGHENVATGLGALQSNAGGYKNVADGNYALGTNTSGYFSTATGYGALLSNTSGHHNTASGGWALRNSTTGSSNIGIGFKGGYNLTTGSNNIDIGNLGVAAESATIRIGTSGTQTKAFIAGIRGVTTGVADQIPVCIDSLGQLGTASCVVSGSGDITGVAAGTGLTGGGTSGDVTLNLNLAASNTWTGNTTFDPALGLAFSTGTGDDIDLGGNVKKAGTLFLHNTGTKNLAVGLKALANVTSGQTNMASGYKALYSNSTGFGNTASGYKAMQNNTTGYQNTASGTGALSSNTTGDDNAAFGARALYANDSGHYNVAIGSGAMFNNTGSRNIAVGRFAGFNLTGGNDNVDIGNQGVVGDSATIRIGTSGTQTSAFVAGIAGVTVSNSASVLIDTTTGQLGTLVSSRRYKEEIHDMGELSERLLKLRPVTFRYKKEVQKGERPVEFGLIAEEVAEVFPELVVYGKDGRPETVKYHVLAPLLLNELQKQRIQVEEQKRSWQAELAGERIARGELEGQLAAVIDRLAALESRDGPEGKKPVQAAARSRAGRR